MRNTSDRLARGGALIPVDTNCFLGVGRLRFRYALRRLEVDRNPSLRPQLEFFHYPILVF